MELVGIELDMKKALILVILSFVARFYISAQSVNIDGINYTFSGTNTLSVASGSYSGNIVIPETVVYEGNGRTYTITAIGENAFKNCTGLTSLYIPSCVTRIRNGAFSGCTNLNSIIIPNSVTTIGVSLFYGCTGLKSVTLSNNISQITNSMFYYCSELVSINIPNGVLSIGMEAFNGCSKLETVSIPNTVTSIGSYAFYDCSSLSSIKIPKGVTTIYNETFSYCSSLSSIVIPKSVNSIVGMPFNNCSNCKDIFCYAKELPTTAESNVFWAVKNATLHVPVSSIGTYRTTSPWSEFNSIEPITTEIIDVPSYGMCTYCSDSDLDFSNVSNLKAYIVSGFSPSTCTLVLTPATTIPAGEGLLLKGEEGTYVIPHTTTDMIYSNLLVGVPTTTYVYPTDGEYTNFILANGIHGINFYTLSEAGNIAGGKAYLKLPTSEIPVNSRALKLCFTDEEITGINTAQNKMNSSSDFYDLQGRKVKSPVKGLYVVNGKKVIIK